MWFKNLRLYTLPKQWDMTAEQLAELLSTQAFADCSSIEMSSAGWVPPREEGGLVHVVGRQMLLSFCTEKKLLPASVIRAYVKVRAAEIEEQQGYKPGRKQMKEIKEDVTDELLPRAFSIKSVTNVWVDPVNGYLAIDSGSSTRCQDILASIIRAMSGQFPGKILQTQMSPRAAMSIWLADDAAPAGFTIDDHIELSGGGDGKGKVKYMKLSAEAEDVKKHIAAGKQCTQLGMTWADRVSFVLTEGLLIKRIAPLDVLKENDSYSADEAEKFDADFTLMTGELHRLIEDLVAALGGIVKDAANDGAGSRDAGATTPQPLAA